MRTCGLHKLYGLILIVTMLVGTTGVVGAHTYDPDRELCWAVDDGDGDDMEWGDSVEVYVEHLNATYTIEVVDFHVQTSKINLAEIERVKCNGREDCHYECGDCSDDDYLDQIDYVAKTVNLRIYKDQTLIGSFPFHAYEDCLESFCTKEDSWDKRGAVWNDGNEFFIGVDTIKCEFDEDNDCFCTDPINEHAEVVYSITKPPEFETGVTPYLMADDEDGNPEELPTEGDSSVVRSNSMFKAEINVENVEEMSAFHVDATVTLTPAEMINGKYPPDGIVEKIYEGEVDADDRTWIDDKFPIDLRNKVSNRWIGGGNDWFAGDNDTTYTVYFKVPSIPKRTKYVMEINLTYEDFKEKSYRFTNNETIIEILPVVEVKKAIGTEDYAYAEEEAVEPYIPEITYVIYEDYEPYVFLTVKNWGDYPIHALSLSDLPNGTWFDPATTDFNVWKCALPPELLKVPDMESDRWNWDFSLKPGEVMMCAYPISLLKPGSYTLGAAIVNWTEGGHNYSAATYQQKVDVHGPYIEVTKTVAPELVEPNGTPENCTAKISVSVANTGDRPTSVVITDQLPAECVLISASPVRGVVMDDANGTFSVRRVLKEGMAETFDYTIDPNRTVMLPPTVVEFLDITAYGGISISEMPILYVNGTKPIGAAAEKIRVEAEKVKEAEKQAAVKALESGVASAEPAETIDTPVRKEPGFTGAIAVITLLAAILLAGRHRRSRR
ncbi:MAG: hypothetical protein C5S47_03475 [Candidatus Methanogasteraceae archaeon]|nr:MAG: hypothetical protein C5S47_03475 [ANME-2 cluster archaeon]